MVSIVVLPLPSTRSKFINAGSAKECRRSLTRFAGSTNECFILAATAVVGLSEKECLNRKAGSINECLTCNTVGSTSECLIRLLTDSMWLFLNCILVLMVSRGWQMEDSTKPAVPPANNVWLRGFFFFALAVLPLLSDVGMLLAMSYERKGRSFYDIFGAFR